jgi:hypothetical protein
MDGSAELAEDKLVCPCATIYLKGERLKTKMLKSFSFELSIVCLLE